MAVISGISESASANTLNISPSAVTGEVLIIIAHWNTSCTISDGTAGTPLTQDLTSQASADTEHTISIFSRRIAGGDPATYTINSTATDRCTLYSARITNPSLSVIYDVAPTAGNCDLTGGSVVTLDAKTITTTLAQSYHFAVNAIDGNVTSTGTPAGYTVEQNGGQECITATYKTIVSPGATGAQTFTFASNTAITMSFAVAVTFSVNISIQFSTAHPPRAFRPGIAR